MSLCEISCYGKKICILASSIEDCLEKISVKCNLPKNALLFLSERGYEIECDEVFVQLCDKGSSFEIKLFENAIVGCRKLTSR